jgi:alpha-mannosidase
MIPRDCTLLLPCRGLDDFPRQLPSADSDNLLAAWLCLWHPALIAASRAAPRCVPAAQPPVDLASSLAVLPNVSRELIPEDLATRYSQVGGLLANAEGDWTQQQDRLLAALHPELQAAATAAVTATWRSDFAALGFAYLQVQLFTRHMRYTSNLDQLLFDQHAFQAAEAVLAGNAELAEQMLQSCFDQLGQERDHYYSLDVSLLDITLLAQSTLTSAITRQLAHPQPSTFVASAALLAKLVERQPEAAEELRRAVVEQRAGLAGGLDVERPHPLMAIDAIRRDLQRGRAAYERLGFPPPQIFSRYTYGQIPDMPLPLRRSGFAGALLVAWEAGSYPSGSHSKFSWEAAEGTFLSAVTPPLIDAADPASYLNLGHRLGEALDHQHVPVFALVHWPNHYSPYFELLRRSVARTPALGRWRTIAEFFEKTDQPYHQEQLPQAQFRYDWIQHFDDLDRQVDACDAQPADLVSITRDYHQTLTRARSLQTLLNLTFQLEQFRSTPAAADPAVPPAAIELRDLQPVLATILEELDSVFDEPRAAEVRLAAIAGRLAEDTQTALERFARAAGYRVAGGTPASPSAAGPTTRLVFNPSSVPQRLTLNLPAGSLPTRDAKWAYACGPGTQDSQLAMCDVPPTGMLRAEFFNGGTPPRRRERTLAESPTILMNDFLEAQIDLRSGALRSLHVPGRRGNRFSFQVAHRQSTGQSQPDYSQMRASDLRVIAATSVLGQIRATGSLLRGETTYGEFQIDYELLRGQRIVQVRVQLSQLPRLDDSPWKSGYVLRMAWPTETAILTTRGAGAKYPWGRGRAIAPLLIEIDETEYKTHLLCGGLAFHQRVEERFLETLLCGRGASDVDVTFGIGVDLPCPLHSARQFVDRTYALDVSGGSGPASSWLMHLDAKQVTLDLEAPLVDASGVCRGVRIQLCETANKSATCHIRALRELAEAHRVDYQGQRIAKLTTEGDQATVVLRPNEMIYVDLLWK